MYSIEYLPLALNDLKEIARYIAEVFGSPQTAIKVVTETTDNLEKVREFPYSATLFTPLKPLTHEYRQLVVSSYSVFYWVTDATQTITVARALHNRRDSSDHLSDNKAKEYR
ncbi:MAG: type II toxin-antitoxin system RelE/ParE family toxin [Fibrobacter sp.]|nr:type II toxin-antitoxin system RelE/ParE family toxin [Fibrobacter sp.]